MESIAYMLQRNPSMVLVLLLGLPSLTWAAAYARRPSKTRRVLAIGAIVVTVGIAIVSAIEAHIDDAPWFPPLVLAAVIAVIWTLLYLWRPKYR